MDRMDSKDVIRRTASAGASSQNGVVEARVCHVRVGMYK
jgi:hypothetical protein